LAIEKVIGDDANHSRFKPVQWVLALLLVMLGWVVFRADSLAVYSSMFSFGEPTITGDVARETTSARLTILANAWIRLVVCGSAQKYPETFERLSNVGQRFVKVAAAPGFVIAVLKLGADSQSPFLTSNFKESP
jgi:hypothetical protein